VKKRCNGRLKRASANNMFCKRCNQVLDATVLYRWGLLYFEQPRERCMQRPGKEAIKDLELVLEGDNGDEGRATVGEFDEETQAFVVKAWGAREQDKGHEPEDVRYRNAGKLTVCPDSADSCQSQRSKWHLYCMELRIESPLEKEKHSSSWKDKGKKSPEKTPKLLGYC
jgi:hypothetical protein